MMDWIGTRSKMTEVMVGKLQGEDDSRQIPFGFAQGRLSPRLPHNAKVARCGAPNTRRFRDDAIKRPISTR
jgi:hypothetical protein